MYITGHTEWLTAFTSINDNVTKRLPGGHLYSRKAILDKHGFLIINATHGKSLYKYLKYLYWSL